MTKPQTKPLRILYFIASHVPTEEERADAEKYGNNVAFRNTMFVEGDTVETDVQVAGAIPDAYADHPRAKKLKADKADDAAAAKAAKAEADAAAKAAKAEGKGDWK